MIPVSRIWRPAACVAAGTVVWLAAAGAAPAWSAPSPQQEETSAEEPEALEAAPAEAAAAEEPERRVIRGQEVTAFGTLHVGPNEVRRGDVICLGCDLTIEGEVTGDVVVVGGSLSLSGRADRDAVCVFSTVQLAEGSQIGRDFVNVMGSLDDQGVSIGNERVNIPIMIGLPGFKGAFGVIRALVAWGKALKTIILFVVLLVLVAFVPERIRVISSEFPVSLGMALLAGLGGYVGLLVVYSLLAISFIGLPVIFLMDIIFKILKTLGMAGIFHYIGKRLGLALNREMSLLGAILLSFVPISLLLVLPFFFGVVGLLLGVTINVLFWLVVEVPAVGLIILTRLGSRPRGQARTAAPAPPPPAAPSPSPVTPEAGA